LSRRIRRTLLADRRRAGVDDAGHRRCRNYSGTTRTSAGVSPRPKARLIRSSPE
jgi:hypothetical protein